MVDTLYAYPLKNPDWGYFDTIVPLQGELARMGDDGSLDRASNTLLINIAPKDFKAKYPMTWSVSDNPNLKFVASFATPFLKNRDNQRRAAARDEFRPPGFAYPAADPNAAVNPAASKEASSAALLGGAKKGFCLGYSHSDMEARGALYDLLDNPAGKPDILFIEEFPKELQGEIDAYLNTPNAPMPKALLDHARLQDKAVGGQTVPKGWEELLIKAKANGIALYGIDSVEADPGVDGVSALQPERRVVMMAKVAADVMKDVLSRPGNANKSFIAGMGAAHANTHEGGIPGIAQIMGLPAVEFDAASGKLAPLPEDTSLRRMPSAPEQAFIEAYIESVEAQIRSGNNFMHNGKAVDLGLDAPTFKADLYASANAMAKRLASGGKLPDANSVSGALSEKMVTDQQKAFKDLVGAWSNRDKAPAATARLAVSAGSAGLMGAVVASSPAILQSADKDGKTLLHHAAEEMQEGCITGLAGPLGAAGLLQGQLGARDREGNTPLHSCVKNRRDASRPHLKGQAAALDALVRAGGDPDAKSASGKTPAHLAALNNNVDAMETLHGHGADFSVEDDRHWTPYDVSIGSTKIGIEQFFYANNIEANDPLVAAGETVNTVEALMRATKSENPADLVKARAAYEKLYSIPELRPMLELVAADAMGKRDTAGGGGARLFIADGKHCGDLYANVGSRAAPSGSYDDGSHVIMIAGQAEGDFAGRLAHELTHTAARITYGSKDTVPFTPGSQEETDYRAAIERDVKETARLVKSDPMESAVADRMSGRMDSYVTGYPAQARLKLDQEYIVGVPQLMAQFGADEVARLSPGLSGFYKGSFTTAVKQKTTSLKNDGTRGAIDDTAIATVAPPVAKKPARVSGGSGVVDSVVDVARASYRADYGTMPAGGNFYSTTAMDLPKTEQDAMEARLQRVKKTMARVIKEQGLPPDVGADMIRALSLELNRGIKQSITDGTSLAEFDKSVSARAGTWVRDTKLAYVKHCDENAIKVPDLVLAEAVVIRAENIAWLTDAPPSDDPGAHLAVEVDAKKHKSMTAELAKKLRAVPRTNTGAETIVAKLSAPISGDKSNGFYRKPKKSSDHVSIDPKSVKRGWMQRLQAL